MQHPIIPRRTIYDRRRPMRDRLEWIAVNFARIYDSLVTILSFGFLTAELSSHLLFEVFDDD